MHSCFTLVAEHCKTDRYKMTHLKPCSIFTIFFSLVLLIKVGRSKVVPKEEFRLKGPQYRLELVPLIDNINIVAAFTRKNYMNFLMKCVFFEGHCDFVGKWLKPRALAALNGNCLACTEYQQENIENWLLLLVHHNEDLFRIAMIKVCVDMEVEVPFHEKIRMIPFLSETEVKKLWLEKPS